MGKISSKSQDIMAQHFNISAVLGFWSKLGVLLILATCFSLTQSLSVNELHSRYYQIFSRSGNRNAASHLWASYILDRSSSMTKGEILNAFSGFCPVSGSPVSPAPWKIWQDVHIKRAGNSNSTLEADIYVCCWPCVCDMMEFVRTDQVDVVTTGRRVETFNALVIGNPCLHPERIPRRAPEVRCNSNGDLIGATRSRNGHIVIGMAQERGSNRGARYSADMIEGRCARRKSQGYRNGMGTIFVDVASINPIS